MQKNRHETAGRPFDPSVWSPLTHGHILQKLYTLKIPQTILKYNISSPKQTLANAKDGQENTLFPEGRSQMWRDRNICQNKQILLFIYSIFLNSFSWDVCSQWSCSHLREKEGCCYTTFHSTSSDFQQERVQNKKASTSQSGAHEAHLPGSEAGESRTAQRVQVGVFMTP